MGKDEGRGSGGQRNRISVEVRMEEDKRETQKFEEIFVFYGKINEFDSLHHKLSGPTDLEQILFLGIFQKF